MMCIKNSSWLLSYQAVWKMQYRGSLGEALIHILIMGNSLIHTKIARTLIRWKKRACSKNMISYFCLTGISLAVLSISLRYFNKIISIEMGNRACRHEEFLFEKLRENLL